MARGLAPRLESRHVVSVRALGALYTTKGVNPHMYDGIQILLADGTGASFGLEVKTAIAAFIVGTVVGITGMGGGALMTPALIFLGVGDASTVVTADLTAAAVYKSAGAVVHGREGSPNYQLAKWLILGSVPMALLGPYLVRAVNSGADSDELDNVLKMWIGFALLLAATTYALRLYIELRRRAKGTLVSTGEPVDPARSRPSSSACSAACWSASRRSGSGSVIMIALLMLYPTLSALKLVGTDLVQAVPLVLRRGHLQHRDQRARLEHPDPAAHRLGARARSSDRRSRPRVPQSYIRRGIVVVLDHVRPGAARQGRLGAARAPARTRPTPSSSASSASCCSSCVPIVWGLLRRQAGLPMSRHADRRGARASRIPNSDAERAVNR